MRVVGLNILKYLLLRLASAALMMVLVAGQSTLLLPPDAADQLLVCLPQSEPCSQPTTDPSTEIELTFERNTP